MRTGKFNWGFFDYLIVLGGLVIAMFGVYLTMPWLALSGLAVVAIGGYVWMIRKGGSP